MSLCIPFSAQPFDFSSENLPWGLGVWPVSWLQFPREALSPSLAAFRLIFDLTEAVTLRVHVSADERYELYLNGTRIGRGPERSTPDFWPFDSYELTFPAGKNVLVVRVQRLGKFAPGAQLSSAPGFLLTPDDSQWLDVLGTGRAAWDVKTLDGISFSQPAGVLFVGSVVDIDGEKFDWDFERGEGEGWTPAEVGDRAIDEGYRTDFDLRPILRPAALPPQIDLRWERGKVRYVAPFSGFPTAGSPIFEADSLVDEASKWQQLWHSVAALEIPPNTKRRVIIDLEDYVCAYPQLRISGGRGALVRWHWQEALIEQIGSLHKGQRDEIEGKFFAMPGAHIDSSDGLGDTFRPDGGGHRIFEALHWRCGRFVEICVQTQHEPLIIENLQIIETRYPLENESEFETSDSRFAELIPVLVRSLQMCAHETYMDCPFYEQLQYVGDTRLEVLTTFAITRDTALPRQALRAFDRSRLVGGSGNGLTQSRAPSSIRQVIPPFSLWWVAMVHDYAIWRDEPELIRELLPGVRAVLDAFRSFRNSAGLVEGPPGWNFGDWARSAGATDYSGDLWPSGIPPEGHKGVSALFNWQLVIVLRLAGELESWFGDDLLAQRNFRDSKALATATHAAFWNAARGLWADNLSQDHWSEHTQCLAILSDEAPVEAVQRAAIGLLDAPDLTRATIYFSHYLLETLRLVKQPAAFFGKLEYWFGLTAQGFKTTPEQPEPTRSDCHAWGAHPLFHFHASILGVRPVGPGFTELEIEPQLGTLNYVKSRLPHPRGEIAISIKQQDEGWEAEVELPEGAKGTFIWNGTTHSLNAGTNRLSFARD